MIKFGDYNPKAVFLYYLFVCVITAFYFNPIILLCSFIFSQINYLQINKKYEKSDIFYIFLFFAIVIINPLVSHNGATVLFFLNDNHITFEAIFYGIASGGAIVSVLFFFKCFNKEFTSEKLTYIFSVFSKKIALIITMTLRFIPNFKIKADNIRSTQKTLGLYNKDNVIDKIKSEITVFSILTTWALENGVITANSMSARGYDTKKHSKYYPFVFTKKDLILLLLLLALFLAVILLLPLEKFSFYPIFNLQIKNNILYVLYFILLFIPTFINILGAVRWHLSASKI